MSEHKRGLIIVATLAVVLLCVLILFHVYRELEMGSEYDPREAAIEKVTQCLEAKTDEEQQHNCGYIIWYTSCWTSLQTAVDDPSNQYAVNVLWYNREDLIPSRGGDEVYMEITFMDGNVFNILWYEDGLESCEHDEP